MRRVVSNESRVMRNTTARRLRDSRLSTRDSQRGFTFVEIVVAVTIFVILLGTLAGIFTRFTFNQRARLRLNAVLGDMQTFLETLEREVRTGFGNTFTAPSASRFEFTNQNGVFVVYERVVDAQTGFGRIERNQQRITAPSVDIRELAFGPVETPDVDTGDPANPNDDLLVGRQGRVTVRLQVCRSLTPEELQLPQTEQLRRRCLRLQTTLTSRQMRPSP